LFPLLHGKADVLRNLATHDGTRKAQQALGISKFTSSDSLGHNQKTIMYPVVQILGTQLAVKIVPHAL
jgi:hypothetical protein